MNNAMLAKNQEWYVQMPGSKMLDHVKISDLTEKTVMLRGAAGNNSIRMKIDDVEFVEEVKKVVT